jgi:hypothetical protein
MPMRPGRGRCLERDYEQAHLLVDFRFAGNPGANPDLGKRWAMPQDVCAIWRDAKDDLPLTTRIEELQWGSPPRRDGRE